MSPWLHMHCMRRVVKRKGSACRSRCFCCPGEACATYACNALILLCLRIAGLYSPCNTRVWTSVYAVPLSEYIPESDCQHELDQPTVLFVSTLKRWIWMLSVLFETGTHSRKIFLTDVSACTLGKQLHFQIHSLLSLFDMLTCNILDSRYFRMWGDFRSLWGAHGCDALPVRKGRWPITRLFTWVLWNHYLSGFLFLVDLQWVLFWPSLFWCCGLNSFDAPTFSQRFAAIHFEWTDFHFDQYCFWNCSSIQGYGAWSAFARSVSTSFLPQSVCLLQLNLHSGWSRAPPPPVPSSF